jgi:hypothetical protein
MAEPHVLSALKRQYAKTLDFMARGLGGSDDLEHLGAVILIFAPDTDLTTIKPIRRKHPRQGRWARAALQTIRTAERPMTIRDLALAVMDGRDGPTDRRVRASIESDLHPVLNRLAEEGLLTVTGSPKRWLLIVS